jgi:hypothetical protein
MSQAARAEAIRQFTFDDDTTVMLISLRYVSQPTMRRRHPQLNDVLMSLFQVLAYHALAMPMDAFVIYIILYACMLIHYVYVRAGGVGLNLVAANVAFMIDPWWNPSTEDQAIDRIHRLGQTREVEVYRFLCKHTVEERLMALQDRYG